MEQENVRAVISMNQDYELKPFSPTFEEWKSIGVEFLQLPTRDFVEAPSLEHIYRGVELIEKYIPSASVYVHCKAGRTRSATLVACYLVKVSVFVCLCLFCHSSRVFVVLAALVNSHFSPTYYFPFYSTSTAP